jgi:hypothetical protein
MEDHSETKGLHGGPADAKIIEPRPMQKVLALARERDLMTRGDRVKLPPTPEEQLAELATIAALINPPVQNGGETPKGKQ